MAGSGTLYLVATPIGNLEDITLRALRILQEVDLIAAEDTRNSRKLLAHYRINTPMTSYHEHNQERKGPQLVAKLLAGANIALITDAGLPGISDPGSQLVKEAIGHRIKVEPIPGANAALTALVASGIDSRQFLFYGFLPRKKKEREEQLLLLSQEPWTVIIYEAPHRLQATLDSLVQCWHGGQVTVARELTKKFEEFIRGTAWEVREHFLAHPPQGEITIVLEGNREALRRPAAANLPAAGAELTPAEQVQALVAEGQVKKDALKQVSKKLGISKRLLYDQLLQLEGKKSDSKPDPF